MNRCDICNKGILHGHNVSHSKRRTAKISKPNLHRVTLIVKGKRARMKLCTSCLRLQRRRSKELGTLNMEHRESKALVP